ncbi:Fic family protein [Asticcacaulis sp. SL142]|uniref:Fic family protein n=1 Tax=Asticcacaulis sp. SL142 TaxID=2995155 RepID=UPI00226C6F7F|nr:Fic family protein [Asticcacaulis sp. SL142]WAC47236.1 Fic family protein [Asticcacaulis sp. SL142]
MTEAIWNWQHPQWPEFIWDAHGLRIAEARFLERAGVVIGASRHLSDDDRAGLQVDILSLEALDTSAIEGERLDRVSVQSSILKELGLSAPPRRAGPAETGIAQVMVDLYQNLTTPLTEADLKYWHRLVMNGRTDIERAGDYRTDHEPMQIVSGAVYDPKVHFEAPPSERVGGEMARFMDWVTATAPDGPRALPAITRAGIAHLWFESIHPFEDGNGRVGRAIIEKLLAQGRAGGSNTDQSTGLITGIAGAVLKHRKAYYAELDRACRRLDITEWLVWFSERALEAQTRTLKQIEFVLAKSRFMERFRGQLNARQEKAILRLFAEGPDGFKGGLSAANYMTITGASTATTTRDLSDLTELGALTRTGERKSTRYHLRLE